MTLSKLSKKQLRAAARHARELAMECVNGTAPDFSEFDYCNCGNGEVARRAGVLHDRYDQERRSPDGMAIQDAGGEAGWLVTDAMFADERRVFGVTKHEAAVFPLLALADELGKAARAAPKESP